MTFTTTKDRPHETPDRSGAFAIRTTRLFDGYSLRGPSSVVVANGRIVSVGAAPNSNLPTVDLGDQMLLPGLVDCHQHLVFDGNGTLEEQVVEATDEELAIRARAHARRALLGGVTTLRDLGDRNYVTLALRGESGLPTILCAGPPITPVKGHCWYLGGECADTGALRRAVAERAERGTDVVKVMVTGGAMTPTMPMWKSQFTLGDVRLVVDLAHAAGLPVAAHCHGIDGIAEAIEAGVDTIEHCTFMNEAMDPDPDPALLERLASSGIPISATYGRLPGAPVPDAWSTIVPKIRAATAEVHRLGGRIVLGSDAGINPHKPHDVAPHAIANFVDLGLSPQRALQAMTADGADALGLPHKGRIVPGADADLIAVADDPTTDPVALTNITAVWHRGAQVR